VLNLQMPGLDGIAVAQALISELPGCASLILTSYGRPGHLKRALAAGAVRNYLSSAAAKLGAANRHEAVQLARSRGWI
jgi:two-component system, NarL family, response regulator DesR